jgi:hypothetical protein
MTRPRVWIVGVGPGGLELLEAVIASGLAALETLALDVDGPLLRRCTARRKVVLPRGLDPGSGADELERLRERLVGVIEPEDLVLMAGDDGAAGPVAVVAELIRELGAHAVVVALVSGRASGGTPPDLDGLMRVATGHRAARETPALSLDLGTAIDALTGVDTELGGPGTRRGGGREARWRPPSRGNGSGGKGEEPPPGPDRDLPTDRVHFTVTAPARVRPGAFFVLDLWAHLDAQREEVLERAREAAEGDPWSRTKGPVEVARGTVLTVRLRVEGLEVDEPEDSLLWDGEIANASFPVFAPREVEPGEARGLATVHAGGLQVAKVHFAIRVEGGTGTVDAEPTATGTALHRRAFASYASADRDGVLGRIQGMQ